MSAACSVRGVSGAAIPSGPASATGACGRSAVEACTARKRSNSSNVSGNSGCVIANGFGGVVISSKLLNANLNCLADKFDGKLANKAVA